MHQNLNNINPLEILREFERGNNIPVFKYALRHMDCAEENANFFSALEGVFSHYHCGELSSEQAMNAIGSEYELLKQYWDGESVANSILEDHCDLGFVYALVNESMPGLFKIGYTKNAPHIRANEMSSSTGVPTQFAVLFSIQTMNCRNVEADIHNLLDDMRVNKSREFFKCSISDLYNAFNSAIVTNFILNGFAFDGRVMRSCDYYPDIYMAKQHCQTYLDNPEQIFNVQKRKSGKRSFNKEC